MFHISTTPSYTLQAHHAFVTIFIYNCKHRRQWYNWLMFVKTPGETKFERVKISEASGIHNTIIQAEDQHITTPQMCLLGWVFPLYWHITHVRIYSSRQNCQYFHLFLHTARITTSITEGKQGRYIPPTLVTCTSALKLCHIICFVIITVYLLKNAVFIYIVLGQTKGIQKSYHTLSEACWILTL
jgi:hypothetical protein